MAEHSTERMKFDRSNDHNWMVNKGGKNESVR